MFKPTKAKSIEGYIAALVPERREAIEFLHRFMQKSAPRLKPCFAYNMLGYGSYKYVNYKKQEVDWPVVALASQKSYISVYVCATDDGQYLAEKYSDELGKVSVGKSCIRFKRLEDVDLKALGRLLKEADRLTAAAAPGPAKSKKPASSKAKPRAARKKPSSSSSAKPRASRKGSSGKAGPAGKVRRKG